MTNKHTVDEIMEQAAKYAHRYARCGCAGSYGEKECLLAMIEASIAPTSIETAPKPLTTNDVARARSLLSHLCNNGDLAMSVPVRETDDDMVLTRVIDAAEEYLRIKS